MEPLGVLFSLQTEDQSLVEFDLSAILDPFDFNRFMLSHLATSLFQKLSPAHSHPVPALFLSPIWAHNVAFTLFWRNNQKIAGPWEGNTV